MDEAGFFGLGLFIGIIMVSIILLITGTLSGIQISKQTANDVCVKLTNNENAIAHLDESSLWNRKLVCEIPSYDSTQNIVIKYNNEEN